VRSTCVALDDETPDGKQVAACERTRENKEKEFEAERVVVFEERTRENRSIPAKKGDACTQFV